MSQTETICQEFITIFQTMNSEHKALQVSGFIFF